jgi:hypothetical protein
MATHTHPADVREHGLQDDCERCEEMAKQPFETLDDDNLTVLIGRTKSWMADESGVFPRSTNEAVAMRVVESAIRSARTIDRLEAL